MDSFSYCDVSSVFLTKTIDRIISPMAVQLCHLIISLECDGSNYIRMSGDVEQMAEELAKATQQLANTAVRVAAECDDGILRQEMEQAEKTLLLFGKNFLLSVQKLTIQPTVRKHQEELIVAAQNILTGTLKLLQLDDDAGVRKIQQAADWLLECSKYLEKAESTSHLLSNFYEFSDALLLVNSLTERRILDLKDSLHQQHLSQTLQILRKCVPMLFTATQSNIKHPYNDQMIASKLYIFDMASKTVHDLKSFLTFGPVKQQSNQRSFAQDLHQLLEILGNPKPTELNNSDLDYLAGSIIFYAMYVADCSRPNIKLCLIKHCQHLLDKRKRLCDYLKESQESPCFGKILYQLEQQCASMKVELKHLNKTLVSTMFYQILDAFAVKDPLKKLLKAAMKTNKKASLHPQNLFASKAFQPLLQAFQSHTDQLLKISSLVLAQCHQQQNIEEIQSSVDYLCRVREEVVALVIDTNKAYYESKMCEKAQSIYQKWIQATESLMMSFDGMLMVHQFLELSIRETEEIRYRCGKLLRSQEADLFQHHAADLCDLVERMAQVVNRHVGQSKDPIFRNGLRVLVRQMESSVLDTRTAIKNCVESISCLTAQKLFLEKVNNLFESIYNVQEGVSGCKHPDLLSPLRSEAGPVSHKPMIIDLNEFEEAKDNGKNHEDHNHFLLYKEYLSKPLPLINSTKEAIRNCPHIEKNIQLTDLQPIVGDLLIAIRKQNTKEVHVCCSSLIEISRIYLQAAKDSFPDDARTENYILRYKDTEDLMFSLVKFSKQGNMDSVLGMEKVIQTAILLSHRVKEIKTYLASLSSYWYSFSFNLFCTSTNSEVVNNTQIFNSIMQRLAGIVQSVSEDLYDRHNDLEFPESSEKHESLVKIHVTFSKCQAAANQLLTRMFCHGLQSDKHRLEDYCILWSVAVHQLSEFVDDFIGINNLLTNEKMDLTELNISQSKTLVLLCETSLWLQEASSLSVQNFTEEKEREKVRHLTEDVSSLTEAVLKVRDDLNISSPPALFLTVECGLLQKELILKAKLLMYHMKNLYRENQTLMNRVVNFGLSPSNSNDRSGIMGPFEKDAKLLIENVTLVKETLRSAVCFTKKEDVEFLVDHLFFLTTDIVARTRLLIENQHQWDIFMLEAMYLNWSAKADQLILHLQSNAEMDVTVLELIKQCLAKADSTETPMTDNPDGLDNATSNETIQSVGVNVSEQRAAKVGIHETSTRRQHDTTNGHGNNTIYKQTASCGDKYNKIDSSNKISSENSIIQREQSTNEGKQWNVLNNGHETTGRKSIKVFRSKTDIGTNNKHNKICIGNEFKTSSVAIEHTTSAKSNESLLDHEIKSVLVESSLNQKANMDPQVYTNATNQASSTLETHVITSGLQKNINCKTSGMKTKKCFTEVKNETTNWESIKDKTHKVLPRVQKVTANQEAENLKTHRVVTGVQKGTANQEAENFKTHGVFTGVQKVTAKQKTLNQKTHAILTGVQKETSNHDTRKQKTTYGVLTEVQTGTANQESKKKKTQAVLTGVQSEADNQQFRDQNTHGVLSGVQREINIQESMNERTYAECIGIQEGAISQELINQKTHTEDTAVPKEITVQESSNKKMHNLVTVIDTETTTNQVIRDQKADMMPLHMTIAGAQTKAANHELANQKTNMVLTTVKKDTNNKASKVSISKNKIKCSQWQSASDKGKMDSKESWMETDNQKSTNPNTYMTPNRRQKESSNKQKEAVIQRMHEKINTEQQESEIRRYTLQGHTQYEKTQQGAFKEGTVATMNLVETDSKQPHVSSRNPRNTTVIVEQQKVNCTSLEDVCWQPHRVAQCLLAEEVETWEGETNTVVKITREMAAQMSYMIQYLNRKGPIQTPEQFIASAKCIAAHGQTFVRFIGIMAKNCTDTRNTSGLLCGMEQIQMISNQLHIVSSVKAATGCGDYSAEEVLLKNAQNLIHSTLETWKAAEAACIKGTENPTYSEEEAEVAAFCSQLRKKLMCQRAKEYADCNV